MAYKALGFVTWKTIRLYLRRRYGGLVTKRRALLAGGAVVATTAGVRAAQRQT